MNHEKRPTSHNPTRMFMHHLSNLPISPSLHGSRLPSPLALGSPSSTAKKKPPSGSNPNLNNIPHAQGNPSFLDPSHPTQTDAWRCTPTLLQILLLQQKNFTPLILGFKAYPTKEALCYDLKREQAMYPIATSAVPHRDRHCTPSWKQANKRIKHQPLCKTHTRTPRTPKQRRQTNRPAYQPL